MLFVIFILLIIYLIFSDTPKNFYLHEHFDENQKESVDLKKEGIDLKNVNAITFSPHKYTTGNRSNPIPQLNCVGGNACDQSSIVKNIQCVNKGIDDNGNVQWECKTKLPSNFELSNTNVNCEGLRGSNDKIKLKGSCGLKYNLDNKNRNINRNKNIHNTNNSYILWIIIIIFVLFLVIIPPIRSYGYGGYYGSIYHPYYSPYYSPMIYNSYSYSEPISNFSTNFGEDFSTGFGGTETR